MSVANDHALVLTNEGIVFAWGNNANGELGLGLDMTYIREPHIVSTLSGKGIKQVII